MGLPVNAPSQDDKNVQASSMRSPAKHISRWGSAWLLPLKPSLRSPPASPKSDRNVMKCCSIVNAKAARADQPLRFSMAPSPQAFTAKPTSFTQIRQKCCSIVNAKPTGADQPLGLRMALPLTPSMRSPPDQISAEVGHGSSLQAISPTPLHPSEASPKPNLIFKHLKCEAHQTCSSYTKTLLAQPLHPAKASHKSGKSFRASSMRSPPDHIGRWASAWFISYQSPSCPTPRFAPSEASPKSTTNVQASSMRSPPEQISRWDSSDISYSASSKSSFIQIRHKCSSSFNAKITRPARSFRFSKPTGPYRAYTDRSSFSIPTAPPFKDQGTDQEKSVSDNHVHTPSCQRCDRRVIESLSGKEIDKEKLPLSSHLSKQCLCPHPVHLLSLVL